MIELHDQNTNFAKLTSVKWDFLRLIGDLKGVNTMFQFEGNNFWTLGTCLSGPRSRVAQNQKTPFVTK